MKPEAQPPVASSRSHSSMSRCRSGAPRSANARCAAAYSCLPSAVSTRTGRRSPSAVKVVRRRAHVEHADVPGQLEAVGHQLRRHHRGEPEGVLVEIHPGVQARRLLERRPVVAPRLQHVERPRRLGEEPERVEVRAGDPVAPRRPRRSRTPRGAAARTRAARRRSRAGRPSPTRACPKQPKCGGRAAVAASSAWIDCEQRPLRRTWSRVTPTPAGPPSAYPLSAAQLLAAGERDAVARGASAAARPGAERVVGEEEVLDRVAHARAAARQVRRRPTARRAPRAASAPRLPLGGVEDARCAIRRAVHSVRG